MQKTLVLLKPDSVESKNAGEIISRFEKKGLEIKAMKLFKMSEELVKEHYDFLVDKPFFPSIMDYMTRGPIVALILEGNDAIVNVRNLCGATNPAEAGAGTIRGDFALDINNNVIHASDSEETAEIEMKRFFNESEILA